jgi:hypothetical protein
MTFESLVERLVVAQERTASLLEMVLTVVSAAVGGATSKTITPPAAGAPAPTGDVLAQQQPPAVLSVGTLPSQAPPSSAQTPPKPRRPRATAPEQTQPAPTGDVLTQTAVATAPAAAVSLAPAPAPVVSSLPNTVTHPIISSIKVTDALSLQTSNAIMALANELSRDAAIAILAQYGVQKITQLKPESYQAVFDETVKTYAKLKNDKLNAALL